MGRLLSPADLTGIASAVAMVVHRLVKKTCARLPLLAAERALQCLPADMPQRMKCTRSFWKARKQRVCEYQKRWPICGYRVALEPKVFLYWSSRGAQLTWGATVFKSPGPHFNVPLVDPEGSINRPVSALNWPPMLYFHYVRQPRNKPVAS